jgi:hypothetical protein
MPATDIKGGKCDSVTQLLSIPFFKTLKIRLQFEGKMSRSFNRHFVVLAASVLVMNMCFVVCQSEALPFLGSVMNPAQLAKNYGCDDLLCIL